MPHRDFGLKSRTVEKMLEKTEQSGVKSDLEFSLLALNHKDIKKG